MIHEPFEYQRWKDGFFFRIYGYGLHVIRFRDARHNFSQRQGIVRRPWKFLLWSVMIITPLNLSKRND